MSEDFLYRRPEVLRQLPPRGHAVIEASAGTGKTYALEHLVVELLLQGVGIASILVVTFTDKAAHELRGRVRGLIERLLAGAEADRAPPDADPAACWRIGSEARRLLGAALREYDSACICTIHAFCRQVLTENAFANQRLFEEELADGAEQYALAFRDTLRRRLAVDPELLKDCLALWREVGTIDELQELLRACEERRGRVVPGYDHASLVSAVAALPERAAARELARYVHRPTLQKTLGATEVVYDALEAFVAEAAPIAAYRALRGVWGSFPEGVGKRALDYLVDRFRTAARRHPAAVSYHQGLVRLAAAIPPTEALVAARFAPLVRERLAERKRALGLFDFQDMLALVDEALAGPRGPALVASLRARFSHALIDEFQDTDEIQWSVFRRIFVAPPGRHAPEVGKGEGRLFLVGDPKQAIYGFRGADVQTFLAAKAEIVGAGQAPVVLRESFRATRPLIEACNLLFGGDYFGGGIAFEPALPGRPSLSFEDPDPEVSAVHVFVTNTERVGGQALYQRLGPAIASEIRRLVDPKRPARFDGKPLCHKDFFVLGRSGRDLVSVAASLREEGIPFAFYKQDGLFQSSEAQAVEDVLAAVADPDDRARRFRAWMTPFFGLRLADLAAAVEVDESDPLMLRLRSWHRLGVVRRDHERLFTSLLQDSGLVRRLLLYDAGERALSNYLHVFEVLREQYVVRRGSVEDMVGGLRAFRQGLKRPPGQNGNLQRLETERDAVQLLTMHLSKGLEAPVVFVVGGTRAPGLRGTSVRTLHDASGGSRERLALVGGSPEELAERAEQESAEEDRRLLYVALTRAKGRLYLPFAGLYQDVSGGDGGGAARLVPAERVNGPYRAVNSRLATLTLKADSPFSYEILPAPGPAEAAAAVSPAAPAAAEGLLGAGEDPLAVEPPATGTLELRAAHAGFTTTSFTRLHDRLEGPSDAVKAETREVVAPADDELPAGAATGSFLHEVIAEVPADLVRGCADPEQLASRPQMARIVERWARRWGIAARHLPHAHALVHTALTARLELWDGRFLDGGIASAPRLLREMDFLYPIPEDVHPRLDHAQAALAADPDGEVESRRRRPRFAIRRGFVVGFVDVLFEHQGLTYFADWKSNCLAAYDAAHVAEEVRGSYALQGRLYTLALVKLLGVHDRASYDQRFGGLLFLFLRGMRRGGAGREGVYFDRPSWEEVVGWEQELRRLDLEGSGGGGQGA